MKPVKAMLKILPTFEDFLKMMPRLIPGETLKLNKRDDFDRLVHSVYDDPRGWSDEALSKRYGPEWEDFSAAWDRRFGVISYSKDIERVDYGWYLITADAVRDKVRYCDSPSIKSSFELIEARWRKKSEEPPILLARFNSGNKNITDISSSVTEKWKVTLCDYDAPGGNWQHFHWGITEQPRPATFFIDLGDTGTVAFQRAAQLIEFQHRHTATFDGASAMFCMTPETNVILLYWIFAAGRHSILREVSNFTHKRQGASSIGELRELVDACIPEWKGGGW